MTTIDRAGLADDLLIAVEMFRDVTRTNANARFNMADKLARHAAALLSLAQPHDVDAGRSGGDL